MYNIQLIANIAKYPEFYFKAIAKEGGRLKTLSV